MNTDQIKEFIKTKRGVSIQESARHKVQPCILCGANEVYGVGVCGECVKAAVTGYTQRLAEEEKPTTCTVLVNQISFEAPAHTRHVTSLERSLHKFLAACGIVIDATPRIADDLPLYDGHERNPLAWAARADLTAEQYSSLRELIEDIRQPMRSQLARQVWL